MKARCLNKKNRCYPIYGGVGVAVCDRWMKFENFISDMGDKPSPQHSIDRIDSSGNYEPSNCRWATSITQGRNTSRNHILSLNGRSMCISEWSEELGIASETLKSRIKSGWSAELTLSLMPDKKNRVPSDR